jgi:hypothetical protein
MTEESNRICNEDRFETSGTVDIRNTLNKHWKVSLDQIDICKGVLNWYTII